MSETELFGVRRLLDDLDRAVQQAQRRYGPCLEVRRVRTDLDHLRESVALLDAAHLAQVQGPQPEMVPLTDAPYDPGLWSDAEDEGIGSQSRHHD